MKSYRNPVSDPQTRFPPLPRGLTKSKPPKPRFPYITQLGANRRGQNTYFPTAPYFFNGKRPIGFPIDSPPPDPIFFDFFWKKIDSDAFFLKNFVESCLKVEKVCSKTKKNCLKHEQFALKTKKNCLKVKKSCSKVKKICLKHKKKLLETQKFCV